MRWYLGYPVLAAGLAFGINTFMPGGPPDFTASAALTQPISTDDERPLIVLAPDDLPEPVKSRLALFSPGPQFLLAEAPSRPTVLDYLAQTLAPLEKSALQKQSPADADPPTPTPVDVAAWTSAVIPTAGVAADAKRVATAPEQQAALARDIQSELRRVGCYFGELDGVWGNGSKRGMSLFMERVNAALPADEPDVFMLSLLRSEPEAICGATCPGDQTLTASGRCVPTTLVVAQNGRSGGKAKLKSEPRLAVRPPVKAVEEPREIDVPLPVLAEARRPQFEGRMGIGGPRPTDAEVLPWMQQPAITSTRTAQLEAALDDQGATGVAVRSAVYEPEVIPSPRAKPSPPKRAKKAGRSQPRGTYRQVQRLFTHPLGRM